MTATNTKGIDMRNVTFKTSGTHCPSCSMMIKMTAEEVAGVATAEADHVSGTAVVEYDPDMTNPEAIAEAIRLAGYGAEVAGAAADTGE